MLPLRRAHTGAHCRGKKPMSRLVTTSQFPDPDAAYLALVEARRNLSDTEAAEFDSRLVLILANHIGDVDVLREALTLAKMSR
jgi:hypothetical protein